MDTFIFFKKIEKMKWDSGEVDSDQFRLYRICPAGSQKWIRVSEDSWIKIISLKLWLAPRAVQLCRHIWKWNQNVMNKICLHGGANETPVTLESNYFPWNWGKFIAALNQNESAPWWLI